MRWTVWVATTLGATALGFAVGRALAPAPVSPLRPAPGADLSAEVLAELRAIRGLLAGEPLVEPPSPPAGPVAPGLETAASGPARLDARELSSALRSLEAALRATGRDGGASPASAGLRPAVGDGGEPRVADLGALRAARAALGEQGGRVVPDLFGLSPAQVYRRFGTPAVVGNSPGRVRWLYEDPDFPGHLVVTFFDGYVGWIDVATE